MTPGLSTSHESGLQLPSSFAARGYTRHRIGQILYRCGYHWFSIKFFTRVSGKLLLFSVISCDEVGLFATRLVGCLLLALHLKRQQKLLGEDHFGIAIVPKECCFLACQAVTVDHILLMNVSIPFWACW